ncbi:MAG: OmpA family protein [Sphingopyxis sp.]
MNAITKMLVGAGATALMAMASHSWLHLGTGFVDKLQSGAETALGNAGGTGVTVAFGREPMLTRIATLSGAADAATKESLLAAVRAVPGVADARWADDGAAATAAAPAEAPASAATVANCQAQVDAAITGQTIQFRSGSAYISPDSSGLIDALAAALGPCAGVVVEVAGHTDAMGNPANNQTLSQARADAVVAALSAKGVAASHMVAHGFGSTQPKVAGGGAAANAANRRIEFHVSSTAAAANAATPAAPTGE